MALEWSGLDTIENTLTIDKTTYSVKDEAGKWVQVTREPKTTKSNRIIPISSKIKKMLLEIKKHSESKYIVGFNDAQMGVRNYQSRFEHMLKKLRIRKFSFHSLRHTFATRCIELGIDIKTVSELLGHSSTTITLDRYVHSSLEQKKRAINQLSKGL